MADTIGIQIITQVPFPKCNVSIAVESCNCSWNWEGATFFVSPSVTRQNARLVGTSMRSMRFWSVKLIARDLRLSAVFGPREGGHDVEMPEPIAEARAFGYKSRPEFSQVENLLVDGPEVSRASRQWRFPGTALVGGICVMAATWFLWPVEVD